MTRPYPNRLEVSISDHILYMTGKDCLLQGVRLSRLQFHPEHAM